MVLTFTRMSRCAHASRVGTAGRLTNAFEKLKLGGKTKTKTTANEAKEDFPGQSEFSADTTYTPVRPLRARKNMKGTEGPGEDEAMSEADKRAYREGQRAAQRALSAYYERMARQKAGAADTIPSELLGS